MSTTNAFAGRTVGELAAENPVSIRVFEAWKIDYCCGGRTPLADACAAVGKTVEEFAAAMEASAAVPDDLAREWASETLSSIAAHIVQTYHVYTREELQTLVSLAEKVRDVHGQRRPELVQVVRLVEALVGDMYPHMLKEEQVLFPYVEQLEDAAARGVQAPTPFFGTVRNPIRMMMIEHDQVGELLASLRTVTASYRVPDDACFSYRELYRRLAEFEERTHRHIHIENNVYFPRAATMEDEAGSAADFDHARHGSVCGR